MRLGPFDFSLRELAGSLGDLGTLLPLAIGYLAVCGLDPAGLLIMMGLANIVTGIIYRLPLPIEPMKVLAVMAIAGHWEPSLVYASGFAMGLVWLVFGLTGIMGFIVKITPHAVIRGIQVALGLLLALEALRMIDGAWLLGLASLVILLGLRNNRYLPGALVLVALGVALMYHRGALASVGAPSLSLPGITGFTPQEVWQAFLEAGLAQIPLTATNAVIATAALIGSYWPDRQVSPRRLALNMGIMNLVGPFFGGMPLCHGAGGLAGQYYFGARTGGANIIEGTIEIALGLFLAASIATLFSHFPLAIVGAMMLLVGLELVRFARDVPLGAATFPLVFTVAVSLLTNMALGFLAGLACHHLGRALHKLRAA